MDDSDKDEHKHRHIVVCSGQPPHVILEFSTESGDIKIDETANIDIFEQKPEPVMIVKNNEKRKSKHFLHVPDCLKGGDDDKKYENK